MNRKEWKWDENEKRFKENSTNTNKKNKSKLLKIGTLVTKMENNVAKRKVEKR